MNKKIKTRLSLLLMALALIILPGAIARFTAKKSFNGSLNVNNHPCDKFKTVTSMGKSFTVKLCTPDFSKTATTKEGMFMAEDDYGESYYYRGVADNWVSFAGFYWRIIRINGDGSIRLIYSGTKTNNTDDGTQIGRSRYNSSSDNEKYADYKISTIKGVVENWYKTNILDKGYDGKIADTGYCNDMTKKSTSDFGAYDRLYNNKIPTLKCPDKANDLLSKSNNKLTYPIALLTDDEASFAGGNYTPNDNYYLYVRPGSWYWTMTPAYWDGSRVHVGRVYSVGYLGSSTVNTVTNVLITSGDGTLSSPFVIN